MVWWFTKGCNIARSVPKDAFKNCWGIQRLNEVLVSDLKGEMLQEGDNESKRYPSLQKIKGKKALPSGNTHYEKNTLSLLWLCYSCQGFSGIDFGRLFTSVMYPCRITKVKEQSLPSFSEGIHLANIFFLTVGG